MSSWRVIRQRPNSDRETVSNFECRNASRSVGLGRSLAESAVRLLSRCRNSRWEAVESRRIWICRSCRRTGIRLSQIRGRDFQDTWLFRRNFSDYAAKQNVDKTFGIYKNPLDKLYYIGNTPIDIRDDNLIVGDEEYEGTPGLWELIISKQPDANVYSRDDFENYAKIMVDTSALKQNNNPAEAVPKSSRG